MFAIGSVSMIWYRTIFCSMVWYDMKDQKMSRGKGTGGVYIRQCLRESCVLLFMLCFDAVSHQVAPRLVGTR